MWRSPRTMISTDRSARTAQWEVVGSYGRCWVPRGVGPDWEPYSDGEWVSTDDGWYWQSDEPWGWACYHYGRWFDQPGIGWCWVPGTEWAPAWVSWREGGDFIGWAPLEPGERFEHGRFEGREHPQRDYVFVQQRRFTERLRPSTVVRGDRVNIRQMTSINNIHVVNHVTVNAGPPRQSIERATGRTIRAVQARDLRRQHEAPVLQRQPNRAPVGRAVTKPAVRGNAPTGAAHENRTPAATTPRAVAPSATTHRVGPETEVRHAPAPVVQPRTEAAPRTEHVERPPVREVTPAPHREPAPVVEPRHETAVPRTEHVAPPEHREAPVVHRTAPQTERVEATEILARRRRHDPCRAARSVPCDGQAGGQAEGRGKAGASRRGKGQGRAPGAELVERNRRRARIARRLAVVRRVCFGIRLLIASQGFGLYRFRTGRTLGACRPDVERRPGRGSPFGGP